MKLSAEIILEGDAHNIEKLFAAEEKAFQNQRASYDLKKENNKTLFKITAEDISALRAVLNSITKLISVYETSKSAICCSRKSERFSDKAKSVVKKTNE